MCENSWFLDQRIELTEVVVIAVSMLISVSRKRVVEKVDSLCIPDLLCIRSWYGADVFMISDWKVCLWWAEGQKCVLPVNVLSVLSCVTAVIWCSLLLVITTVIWFECYLIIYMVNLSMEIIFSWMYQMKVLLNVFALTDNINSLVLPVFYQCF